MPLGCATEHCGRTHGFTVREKSDTTGNLSNFQHSGPHQSKEVHRKNRAHYLCMMPQTPNNYHRSIDYCALEEYLEDVEKIQDTAVFSVVSMLKIEKKRYCSLVALTKKLFLKRFKDTVIIYHFSGYNKVFSCNRC